MRMSTTFTASSRACFGLSTSKDSNPYNFCITNSNTTYFDVFEGETSCQLLTIIFSKTNNAIYAQCLKRLAPVNAESGGERASPI